MPDSTIESFVDEIAQRSKIDPLAAETAVGTILSVIQQWLRGRRRRSSTIGADAGAWWLLPWPRLSKPA